MTALLDAALAAPLPAAATTVTALVVTTDEAHGLRPLLDALAAQTLAPDAVVVLDRTPDGAAGAVVEAASVPFAVEVAEVDPATSTRQAVLAHAARLDSDLVWVLPCGVVPASEALGLLLAPHRRSSLVAVTGPKILDGADPGLLRSAGIQATRSGRLVAAPAAGERDQRQYDERRDVLAVPAAGALVDTAVLVELGGWHPPFGDVGADLDLGWRVQLAGRRVELVPSAVVRAVHGLGGAEADTGPRRRAARRVALARAAWWTAPFLALWILVSALVSGLALLLLKRPRAAFAEFAVLGALDPVRAGADRWQTRTRPVVRRRHLRGLFVPARAVRQRLADAVSAALAPNRGRAAGDDRPAPARSTLARVVGHPGVLAVTVSAATVVAAGRTLGTAPLTGLSGGLTGGELVGGRADSAALWSAWSDGWTGAGLGGPGSGSPYLALLAVLTWIVEHVPGLGSLSSPAGATVGVLLLLTPVLAALSYYLAAHVTTSNRWLRGAAACVWATAGAAGPAYAAGRVGALAILVLLPLAGSGLVLLARRDGTATSAWATALGIAVLGVLAPAVAGLLVVLAIAIAVAGPCRAARRRALVPALVAPATVLLYWPGALDDPRRLLTGPGLAQWGGRLPETWQVALGYVGGAGSPLVWFSLPLVVLGVAGLMRGQAVRSLTTGLAVLALLALGGLAVLPRLQLADIPTVLTVPGAAPEHVTPWTGQMVLVLTGALLTSAILGLERLAGAGRGRWRSAARTISTVLAIGLATSAVAGLALATLGNTLRPWREVRPAVAVEHADGPLAGRTLAISATSRGPGYAFVGRETSGPARDLPSAAATGPAGEAAAPAATVSALLDGSRPDTSAGALRRLAVGFVALDEKLGDDMARRLDATEGLTRLAPRDGWRLWRVTPGPDAADIPIGPARVRIVTEEGSSSVAVDGSHATLHESVTGGPDRRLVVSELPGWAAFARVTLDGTELVRLDEASASSPDARASGQRPGGEGTGTAGEVAYPLPASGTVDISLTRGPDWLPSARLLVLVVLIFLAVPFGSRESRRRG